jgi:hypothetical protein
MHGQVPTRTLADPRAAPAPPARPSLSEAVPTIVRDDPPACAAHAGASPAHRHRRRLVHDGIGGGGTTPATCQTGTRGGGDGGPERGKPLGSRRRFRSAPTAVARTHQSYVHRVR